MKPLKTHRTETGFTLVEMLVALALFAAIAAMGAAMLRGSVDAQDSVQKRLASMSGWQRLRAIMTEDLGQALPRWTRDERGTDMPAFIGGRDHMAFVAGGTGGWQGGDRPDAQRTEYRLVDGVWQRAAQPMLDGTMMGAGDALARDVRDAQLRYRDAAGAWHDRWPVGGAADQGAAGLMPRAVELRLARGKDAPLVMLFLVGPVPVTPPLPEADGQP